MNKKPNILFVSHDVNRAGAQIFLWNIMMKLKEENFNLVFLAIDTWGSMKADFENNFETYYYNNSKKTSRGIKALFDKQGLPLEIISKKFEIDLIYANTIACMDLLPILKEKFNCQIISHIHELGFSIKQFGTKNSLNNLFNYSNKIIACSQAVADNLLSFKNSENIEVIHSFVDNNKIQNQLKISDKNKVKDKFALNNFYLVGACGNADWRKATDIFVKIASNFKEKKEIKFVWIGIDKSSEFFNQIAYDSKKLETDHNIIWIEPTAEAVEIINCLDVFLVCSREDPFPLVMLEAALCSKPILGFKKTGGADEFVENNAGILAEYLNDHEMAENILKLYNDTNLSEEFGQNALSKVLNKYNFENSFEKIKVLLNRVMAN